MKEPFVYIQLVNYKKWEDTIECLESIFRLKYKNFQVIILDNDSRNGSLQHIHDWCNNLETSFSNKAFFLKKLTTSPIIKPIKVAQFSVNKLLTHLPKEKVVFLQSKTNLGFASGHNIMFDLIMQNNLQKAYSWVLNPDTLLHPQSLTEVVKKAQQTNSPIGAIGSKLLYYNNPNYIQCLGGGIPRGFTGLPTHLYANKHKDSILDHPPIEYVYGAAMLIPTSTLKKIGVFDPNYFFTWEEKDLCLRMKQAGYLLEYSDKSIIWHKEGSVIGFQSIASSYYFSRGLIYFHLKNHTIFIKSIIVVIMLMSLLVKRLIKFKIKHVYAVLQGAYDGFKVWKKLT